MDTVNGTLLVSGVWALVFVELLQIWFMLSDEE